MIDTLIGNLKTREMIWNHDTTKNEVMKYKF